MSGTVSTVLKVGELEKLANDRLEEAKILLDGGKSDGAHYIGGYSVELGLKKKICDALNWDTYPPSNPTSNGSESFADLGSFRTHDPSMLLLLSGQYKAVHNNPALLREWNNVKDWNSELRYELSARTEPEVRDMLRSAVEMLKHLGLTITVTI